MVLDMVLAMIIASILLGVAKLAALFVLAIAHETLT